jgi:hypothetical protein
VFQRPPAGSAERLEAGELRLDGYAVGTGRRDQIATTGFDRGGGAFTRIAVVATDRGRPRFLRRNRVEPETDLAAALGFERRKPVRERCLTARRRLRSP